MARTIGDVLWDMLYLMRRQHIPGRLYFYLNFWIIFAMFDNGERKDKRNPKFTSLDYFMVIELMFYMKEDNMFPKSRQKGLVSLVLVLLLIILFFFPAL